MEMEKKWKMRENRRCENGREGGKGKENNVNRGKKVNKSGG